jgi:hypothetical protein
MIFLLLISSLLVTFYSNLITFLEQIPLSSQPGEFREKNVKNDNLWKTLEQSFVCVSDFYLHLLLPHLPASPCGPPVQPCRATSAASSQSSLTLCWPSCPVVASGSTPPSRPLSNPYVPPPGPLVSHTCLDTGHLVLE